MYISIETEEELEQLFNAGINNGRDKEEANQQDRKDKDENQTNNTSQETVQKKHDKKVYCMICEKELSGAHKCSVCDQFFHAVCGGYREDSEDFGQNVTCNLCVRKNPINIQRQGANSGQKQQAHIMVFLSTQNFQLLILGQTLWSGCLTLIEDVYPPEMF
jgi:hypothetical protein